MVSLKNFTETVTVEKYGERSFKVLDYSEYSVKPGSSADLNALVIVRDDGGVNHSFEYAKSRDGMSVNTCKTEYRHYVLKQVKVTPHILVRKTFYGVETWRFNMDENFGELMCGKYVEKPEIPRQASSYNKLSLW